MSDGGAWGGGGEKWGNGGAGKKEETEKMFDMTDLKGGDWSRWGGREGGEGGG